MKRILILTEPGDGHAHAVAEALRARDAEPLLYHTPDFPSRSTETVLFEGDTTQIHIDGLGTDLTTTPVDVVWRRRPSFALDEEVLHPADQEFAHQECATFRHSFFPVLCPQAFWVNPHEGAIRAGQKLIQHQCARGVGLGTPDSLYSNDPQKIRAFIKHHGGQIVYKPLRPACWHDEETSYVPFTSLLTADQLVDDALLKTSPGIYQELLPKAYELRVTMMGRRAFGAKVLSQETEAGKLDWRKAYTELRMEPFDVSRDLAAACFRLLERLGIVFGCFDFIVTPAGETVFLEVNEMGQFLFIETYTGLPLLDAFCEFLLQASTEFTWHPDRVRIRYDEVREKTVALVSSSSREHIAPARPSVWEGAQESLSPEKVSTDPAV
jgi:MvdD-like protein with pre-ATP grasp domain